MPIVHRNGLSGGASKSFVDEVFTDGYHLTNEFSEYTPSNHAERVINQYLRTGSGADKELWFINWADGSQELVTDSEYRAMMN